MLTVISPAKRLDWDGARQAESEPRFTTEANRLAGHARQLSLAQLKTLMGLSDALAQLNRDRFRSFSATPGPHDTRAAGFAFAGDTYSGLEAATLDEDTLRYAQTHLRILSGLYGVLRPLDAIQPYRLEMGSRLATRRGKTLYQFWGDRIATALKADADAAGTRILLNCASQEYFGAVALDFLDLDIVTPVFLEERQGQTRVVSFYAKRARGAMARFVMERRIDDPEDLAAFDAGGYRFSPERSEPGRPVFVRADRAEASDAA